MMLKNLLFIALFLPSLGLCQGLIYPETKKTDVTDTYFGVNVPDPYRWLEDDNSPETAEWVNKENEVTYKYLSQIPFRDTLKSRMEALWDYPKYSPLYKAGHRYFYFKNMGLQNQPVLYFMPGLNYVPMMYFDPNKLSDDGTVSLQQISAGKKGDYMAFLVAKAGSDWNEIRIKEVSSTKTLPEVLSWVKFSGIAWKDSGFYYSRYEPKTKSSRNEFHKIYYHRINTQQLSDSLVWEDKQHPLRNFSASTTADERFLIITGSESTSGNSITIQDLDKKSKPVTIVDKFDNDFELVGSNGDEVYFVTNYKAPKKRLIAINPSQPAEANWKVIIPEKNEILLKVSIAKNNLLVHYMKDASSRLYIYNFKGTAEAEIPLGNFGTVSDINCSPNDSLVFFSFTTFTSPEVVHRFNMNTRTLYTQFPAKLPYNPDDYETTQVFYTSKDQTKIPMFLVHKKGLVLNPETPTLLFGYGGFDISKTPEFKPERMVFLEQGGLFVMANLRGGGEYGEAWHKAGTKLKKQNVFDDFIAAAEFLIAKKYTSPSKLAISGRSNGGLLVGATLLQRPDLFKAAVPVVGVLDMLRYHKFTIGWSWVTDYGTSDNAEEFKALYKYSPLHNVKTGVNYPATLITTGDHDDRVVPSHSFKFAATLQEKYKGPNPVIIRIDTDAGHGSGKPTSKLINEQADIFSFLFYQLGMKF